MFRCWLGNPVVLRGALLPLLTTEMLSLVQSVNVQGS